MSAESSTCGESRSSTNGETVSARTEVKWGTGEGLSCSQIHSRDGDSLK